jgi:hypothetical protein
MGAREIDMDLFNRMRHYLARIGRYWARIAVDTNPDFDGQDIPDEDILSGLDIVREYLAQVVTEIE